MQWVAGFERWRKTDVRKVAKPQQKKRSSALYLFCGEGSRLSSRTCPASGGCMLTAPFEEESSGPVSCAGFFYTKKKKLRYISVVRSGTMYAYHASFPYTHTHTKVLVTKTSFHLPLQGQHFKGCSSVWTTTWVEIEEETKTRENQPLLAFFTSSQQRKA